MITAATAFTIASLGHSFKAGDTIHLKSEDQPDGLEQVQIDKLLKEGLARDSTKPYEQPAPKMPVAPAGVEPGKSKGKNAAPKIED